MSQLEKMYNWNGNYKILKPLEKKCYKVSDEKYPEFLYLMENEDNTLRYSIIDDFHGYPALANTMDTPHSLKLRANVVNILNELEKSLYINKIDK